METKTYLDTTLKMIKRCQRVGPSRENKFAFTMVLYRK